MTRSTRGRATRIPSRIRSRAWTLRNLSNFRRLQFLRELARVVLAPKHQTWLVGQDDPDLLVWRAPSTLMNPSLKPARLERERRLDAVRFAREYEAEFVDDVAAFLPGVWIDDFATPMSSHSRRVSSAMTKCLHPRGRTSRSPSRECRTTAGPCRGCRSWRIYQTPASIISVGSASEEDCLLTLNACVGSWRNCSGNS